MWFVASNLYITFISFPIFPYYTCTIQHNFCIGMYYINLISDLINKDDGQAQNCTGQHSHSVESQKLFSTNPVIHDQILDCFIVYIFVVFNSLCKIWFIVSLFLYHIGEPLTTDYKPVMGRYRCLIDQKTIRVVNLHKIW